MAKRPTLAGALLAVWLLSCGDAGTEPEPGPPPPPPNRAPVAAGAIPAQTVVAGGTTTVDVSSYFADPDGDALTFTATSSDTGITSVAVSGSTVTVMGSVPGSVRITVTARDPGGLEATQGFSVNSPAPPVVSLTTTAADAAEGRAVTLDIVLSPAPAVPVTVAWVLGPDADTATADADSTDFDGGSGEIRIAAGDTAAAFEILINDDDEIEPPREHFTAALAPPASGAGYELGSATSAAVTILEGVCDRTPAIARAIVEQAAVRGCSAVETSHLAAIRGLAVLGREDPMTALRERDLRGLSDLAGLYIVEHPLTELPKGVFSGLSRLSDLNLGGNQLTELPEGVFSDLVYLNWLDLRSNRLAELSAGTFDGLSRLQGLNLGYHDCCGRNQLTRLPEGVFPNLPQLYRLNLDGNQLTELPSGAFAALPQLEWLSLTGNQLTELPAAAFTGLRKLYWLNLTDNQLTALPRDALPEASLQWLILDGNQLSELPVSALRGLDQLESLSLRGNRLSSLPAGELGKLPSLEHVSLDENRLTRLPDGVFEGASGLRGLGLGGNQLTELSGSAFSGLPNLRYLILANNDLTELPPTVFWGLSGLEILRLAGNSLVELPEGVFSGLSKLYNLDITDNRLTDLPDGVFSGLYELFFMYAHGNPGNPFPLTLELRRTDSEDPTSQSPARVVVTVDKGAPFPMRVPLSVSGGNLSASVATVVTGNDASAELTVTRAAGNQAEVRVEMSEAPPIAGYMTGFGLSLGDPLVLFGGSATGASRGAGAGTPEK